MWIEKPQTLERDCVFSPGPKMCWTCLFAQKAWFLRSVIQDASKHCYLKILVFSNNKTTNVLGYVIRAHSHATQDISKPAKKEFGRSSATSKNGLKNVLKKQTFWSKKLSSLKQKKTLSLPSPAQMGIPTTATRSGVEAKIWETFAGVSQGPSLSSTAKKPRRRHVAPNFEVRGFQGVGCLWKVGFGPPWGETFFDIFFLKWWRDKGRKV